MAYHKPLPTTTLGNMAFWDGLKEHQFKIPHCRDCGAYSWVPYPACKNCQSENIDWDPISGQGEVWTYSIVHRGAGFHQTPPTSSPSPNSTSKAPPLSAGPGHSHRHQPPRRRPHRHARQKSPTTTSPNTTPPCTTSPPA